MEDQEATIGHAIEVDTLYLANAAEVQNGLVYALGGGWSRCWPSADHGYPYSRILTIVLMFRVPWNETNVQHNFRLLIRDEDRRDIAQPVVGAFKSGRQADLLDGASQIIAAVFPIAAEIPGTGLFTVAVEIDGDIRKQIQFEAIAPHG